MCIHGIQFSIYVYSWNTIHVVHINCIPCMNTHKLYSENIGNCLYNIYTYIENCIPWIHEWIHNVYSWNTIFSNSWNTIFSHPKSNCSDDNVYTYILTTKHLSGEYTGWQRLIGSPKLQIIFHKRATKYTSLSRKVTCKDTGSYESSPPWSKV